jgi:hypothetical protein
MPKLIITSANYLAQQRLARERLAPYAARLGPGCLKTAIPRISYPWCRATVDEITPIPRKLWKGLIEQPDSPTLADLRAGKLPPHNQGRTNYCWAHGSVRTVEIENLFQTGIPTLYSAESIAVPVTNGRNRGGYPEEALKRLVSHGTCHQDLWPLNDLSRSLWTPEVEADARQHRLIKWLYVKGWDMQVTLAILRVPIAIGLRWWGHLVCQLDAVILPSGEVGIGIDNSWGDDWGENGYGYLDEETGTADLGAFAPITQQWESHLATYAALAARFNNFSQVV